jgi:hypothetical protein
VYVLFMRPNGTVKAEQKISDTQGNFQGGLENGDLFGCAVAAMDDLDGINATLAVGAWGNGDGGQQRSQRGAVFILFLGQGRDRATTGAIAPASTTSNALLTTVPSTTLPPPAIVSTASSVVVSCGVAALCGGVIAAAVAA